MNAEPQPEQQPDDRNDEILVEPVAQAGDDGDAVDVEIDADVDVEKEIEESERLIGNV